MKIKVKVRPNSKKQEIVKINDTEYKISLSERAKDNKANIELLKLLKRYFKKPVKLIKGINSKEKLVKIEDGNKI